MHDRREAESEGERTVVLRLLEPSAIAAKIDDNVETVSTLGSPSPFRKRDS